MLNYQIIHANGARSLTTNITGKALMSIPQLNKGTAFTDEERQIFGLEGKLPIRVETLEEQVARALEQFRSYKIELNRNIFLNTLLHTNVTLFFRLVKEHIKEMLPTMYTPIVGTAVETFNKTFVQTRGLYIAYPKIKNIARILKNRSHKNIQLIVASDGEGVLGIGDQGVGAMDIAIAKLSVYTIFAGVNPLNTLPIMLDVGTDNEKLLNDPMYLGWRHPRIKGKDYQDFMDYFVDEVKKELPDVFMHWEDFGRDTGYSNLERYRKRISSFNDDIQGTGVVSLAALLSAVKITGVPVTEQKIVIFGAGTAGMGVTDNLCQAMVRAGLTSAQAHQRFYLVDRFGLLTEDSKDTTPPQHPYLKSADEISDWEVKDKNNITLAETVQHVRPSMLIGCSTQQGAFTKEIIQCMAAHCEHPIVFPLSNPTNRAEATPADIIEWTNNKVLVATGSPFEDVNYQGKMVPIPQCNNYLAFPGIGVGVMAVKAKEVTGNMLTAASEALSEFSAKSSDMLLPTIADAAKASRVVAAAVAKAAIKDGVNQIGSDTEIDELLNEFVWEPEYLPYELGE